MSEFTKPTVSRDKVNSCSIPGELVNIYHIPTDNIADEIQDQIEVKIEQKITEEKIDEFVNATSHLSSSLQITRTSKTSFDAPETGKRRGEKFNEAMDINEEKLQKMKQNDGLQRLQPSRRQKYYEQILYNRLNKHIEEKLDELNAQNEIAKYVSKLFKIDSDIKHYRFKQDIAGKYVSVAPSEDHEIEVIISDHISDWRDHPISSDLADFVVPLGGSKVIVDTPYTKHKTQLDPGLYTITIKPILEAAQQKEIIEMRGEFANKNHSGRDSLYPSLKRGEHDDRPKIINIVNDDKLEPNNENYDNNSIIVEDHELQKGQLLITIDYETYTEATKETMTKTWLIGKDSSQGWSHEVPSGTTTISEAWAHIMPKKVISAKTKNKQIIRQGNVWFVEATETDLDSLSETLHTPKTSTEQDEKRDKITVTHPYFTDIVLSDVAPDWKAYVGRVDLDYDVSHPAHAELKSIN